MDQFISRETLNMLSYCSTLGQGLKQISLRATPLETILDDIAKYRSSYIDVLGFRLRFNDYPEEYPDYFRVVDLRNGKKIDDGYRAIHLYYQRDNLAYPIEVQLWCGKDYAFNIWSHQYVYKYKIPEIGKNVVSGIFCWNHPDRAGVFSAVARTGGGLNG